MRRKWKVHKGWIKIHVSVGDRSKQVVALSVTDDGCHDTREFCGLVGPSVENVKHSGYRSSSGEKRRRA
jgi:hypothetical protein